MSEPSLDAGFSVSQQWVKDVMPRHQVVGCLIEHDNKILLCQRKIQPSYGLWTLPAGYMEIGESAAEGAIRETWEEAGAEVEVLSPFAQLDIPRIGQTYIIFLAKLKRLHFSPGPESSDCRLFSFDDIPFDSLAFSSMLVTLNLYIADRKVGRPRFHYGTINKRFESSLFGLVGNILSRYLNVAAILKEYRVDIGSRELLKQKVVLRLPEVAVAAWVRMAIGLARALLIFKPTRLIIICSPDMK
ncbi:hypothetical protein RHMOL_Rhmol04G0132500 [Rhododendron molle]|uniref:Uncharacterized protein n=1 Tax=Rhododendron molle TaxID=49168 RepID=A0ACC0P1N6_RHOML|nr:hypothetical protein RHMOL_Rhmol04G0132500 [Rhododendron molle]